MFFPGLCLASLLLDALKKKGPGSPLLIASSRRGGDCLRFSIIPNPGVEKVLPQKAQYHDQSKNHEPVVLHKFNGVLKKCVNLLTKEWRLGSLRRHETPAQERRNIARSDIRETDSEAETTTGNAPDGRKRT